jgi:hypothetical protein
MYRAMKYHTHKYFISFVWKGHLNPKNKIGRNIRNLPLISLKALMYHHGEIKFLKEELCSKSLLQRVSMKSIG